MPLGEYVDGKIFYGIKTGLNEAFVIDEATKERLIAEDPKSAEVIKPFLAGRDIKRYVPPVAGNFLILFPKGWTREQFGDLDEDVAYERLKKIYPAIFDHLFPFADKARKRYDQGEYWWELRACDYYEEFEKPKIIYAEIATVGQFTFDKNNLYGDTTSYIMPVESKFFLGILNSKIFTFIFSNVSSEIRGGFFRWKRQYMKDIPLPKELADNNFPILAAPSFRCLCCGSIT